VVVEYSAYPNANKKLYENIYLKQKIEFISFKDNSAGFHSKAMIL
jgi:hypothetical protein